MKQSQLRRSQWRRFGPTICDCIPAHASLGRPLVSYDHTKRIEAPWNIIVNSGAL